VEFPRTVGESAAGMPVPRTDYPPGDVRRYGAIANKAGVNPADNSQIIQSLFNMTQSTGGKISFPGGDWSLYLDISARGNDATASVIIEGNGATFRCFTPKPEHSCVIYADNSKGSDKFLGSNVQFNDCNFVGRRFGSDTHGDVDYAVFFNGTAAAFYGCSFQYALVAGFYSMFGQYNEFWSCEFGSCTATPKSTGCVLDSRSATASTNEVLFERCKFFVCSNFLTLFGCFSTRIRDSTFQGSIRGGGGGIILEADATGQGTVGTIIDGCWFEINASSHIVGRVCQGTRIHGNSFFSSGGVNAVRFDFCFDLEVSNNIAYTPIEFLVNHPAGDTMKSSVIWQGNNFVPALNLDHAGPTCISLDSPAAGVRRNDNMLITTGQSGPQGMPLVQADLCGFRTLVPRRSETLLFRLNFDSDSPAEYLQTLFVEIQLSAWQDTDQTNSYGACAAAQRFHAFVTNAGGTLRAFVESAQAPTAFGADPTMRSLGALSLFAAAKAAESGRHGGSVSFSISYDPTGRDLASVTTATVAYRLAAASCGGFTMTRF